MQTPSGYKVKGVSFTQVFSCFVVVFFYNLPTNKFEHQSIFLVLLTNPMSCENSIKRVFDFRNPAQWPFWYDIFQKIWLKSNHTIGQLILKGLLGFFNSSKKRMKNFCPSRLGQNLKVSSSLFGGIEDTKKTFRN